MSHTTGDIIKFLRKRDGLSQEDLGEYLGVKRITIQKYESNSISLRMDTIKAMSNLFQISPWILVFPETMSSQFFLHLTEEQMSLFFKLNDTGRAKVLEYIEDLTHIEKYKN